MSTRNAEAILMRTRNVCFYGELTKIILELSSNTLLICSTDAGDDIQTGSLQTDYLPNIESFQLFIFSLELDNFEETIIQSKANNSALWVYDANYPCFGRPAYPVLKNQHRLTQCNILKIFLGNFLLSIVLWSSLLCIKCDNYHMTHFALLL